MKKLPFVLWTILFPVAISLSNYLDFMADGNIIAKYSNGDHYSSTLLLIIWVFVAYSLYEDDEDEDDAAENQPGVIGRLLSHRHGARKNGKRKA